MKIIKPILITTLIMAAVAGGVVFLLMRTGGSSGQKTDEIVRQQRDVTEQSAYEFDVPKGAVELKTEGDEKNVLNFANKNVYNVDTSTEARQRLDRVVSRMSATIEQPVVALNPFGTNKNSYYFNFATDFNAMIRYTIMVEDESIPDFVRYVNNGKENNLTRKHEFTVSGLVPGMKNYIKIEAIDKKGTVRKECVFCCDVTKGEMASKNKTVKGYQSDTASLGLYYLFPSGKKHIYAYDNSGILRNITVTEGNHGKRFYQTDNAVLYQVSDTKVAMVSAVGQVTGVAEIKGYGEIRDFSYDGFEYVFALMRKSGKDILVRKSLKKGKTEKVYEFPKDVHITSISAPSAGVLYAAASNPSGIVCLKAVSSNAPGVGYVIGEKSRWKNTSLKKKVKNDKTLKKWDMKNCILNQNGDVSEKKASFTTYLTESGKGNALTFEIKDKKININVKFDVGEKGKSSCQEIDDHWIISTLSKGIYEEYEISGNVIRRFETGRKLDSVVKCALNGMCFYIG